MIEDIIQLVNEIGGESEKKTTFLQKLSNFAFATRVEIFSPLVFLRKKPQGVVIRMLIRVLALSLIVTLIGTYILRVLILIPHPFANFFPIDVEVRSS